MFVSEQPLWPPDQGYRLRGYHMATGLADRGLRIAVASIVPGDRTSPQQLRSISVPWPSAAPSDVSRFKQAWSGMGGRLRQRLARRQGLESTQLAGVLPLVERYRPNAVIGMGLHSPLLLHVIRQCTAARTIWYAADEPAAFQCSCMRYEPISALPGRMASAMLFVAMQRLFVRGLDGAVGVSDTESRRLSRIGAPRYTLTIPNGVDLDYFAAATEPPRPRSLVFWGRMDFEPNVDAVCWFARHVWPRLVDSAPDARWQIVGMNPHARVNELHRLEGVQVVGAVDDIRPIARRAAAAILPMRVGGGIKNKLLEAAAMGVPIVATPRALGGLRFDPLSRPLLVCHDSEQWISTILRLWADAAQRRHLAAQGRRWVQEHHTWPAAAHRMAAWIKSIPVPDHPPSMRSADAQTRGVQRPRKAA